MVPSIGNTPGAFINNNTEYYYIRNHRNDIIVSTGNVISIRRRLSKVVVEDGEKL
ncbi:MAG: hypothetical protein ABRQ27_08665 [Clostridiaceae bacterium]